MRRRRIAAIASILIRRELRNPVSVAMFALVPLAAAFVFGLADQRANNALPVGIVRVAPRALTNDLVAQFHAESELRVSTFPSQTALENAVRRGDVYAGIIVPGSYDQQVAAGRPASVIVVGDNRQSVFTAAQAAITLVVDRENAALEVARHRAESGGSLGVALPVAHRLVGATAVHIERRTANAATRATGLGRATAGMLVFFVFSASMFHAVILVGDRRLGITARMATTRASETDIVAGEFLGRSS